MTKFNQNDNPNSRSSTFVFPNGVAAQVENLNSSKEVGFGYIDESGNVKVYDGTDFTVLNGGGGGGTGNFTNVNVTDKTTTTSLEVEAIAFIDTLEAVGIVTDNILSNSGSFTGALSVGGVGNIGQVNTNGIYIGTTGVGVLCGSNAVADSPAPWVKESSTVPTSEDPKTQGSAISGILTVKTGTVTSDGNIVFELAPLQAGYRVTYGIVLTPANQATASLAPGTWWVKWNRLEVGATSPQWTLYTDQLGDNTTYEWNYHIIGNTDING